MNRLLNNKTKAIQEITSLQHHLIKHLAKLRDDKKYRYEQNCVMIHGYKIVEEALSANLIRKVFACSEADLNQYVKEERIETFKISAEAAQKISGCTNTEKIFAEVEIPVQTLPKKGERILALDAISDPGNLGTLIRTAFAFSWDGIFILSNSVDPFNQKALNSAKGATFRIPCIQSNHDLLESYIRENNSTCLIADIHDAIEFKSIEDTLDSIVLILGNESHGPSNRSRDLGQKIYLPMNPQADSLNVAVAGSILIHHFSKFS